jgi:hypothetical protein
MAFIRKVKTASGSMVVQINHEECDRFVHTDRIGGANTEKARETLLVLAEDRLHGSQLSQVSSA